LEASTYSKSVLRVAAAEIAARHDGVRYFPAYEIVTGSQAPEEFFEPDRRNVTKAAIQEVMGAFFAGCRLNKPSASGLEPDGHERQAAAQALSQQLIAAECEEVMADSAIG
jgi:hypothetical protein